MISKRRRRWNVALVVALGATLFGLWVWVVQPWAGRAPRRELPEVEPARLEAHVRALTERFFPRSAEDPEHLSLVSGYIHQAFEEAGGRPAYQVFRVRHPLPGGPQTYRNVLAHYGPERGPRIVIGAHFDAAGRKPGADDNASGVAVLLELARLLQQQPPKTRVDLVAWNLEEPPYFRGGDMGSQHHAALLKREGADVRAVISLEMVGCFSDLPGSQQAPSTLIRWLYPSTGNFITVVGRLGDAGLVRALKRGMRGGSELPVESIDAPRFVPGIDWSDHASYWEQGYPAVMITDTSFYRNPRYHTEADTADTLDYRRMAQVTLDLRAAIDELGS